MQWENLTSEEFAKAVSLTGVCIIAMGVVEKHSEHLPLGTDYLNGHKIASMASEKEPAVVFPPTYYGQIYEARCFPGTITLKPTLLVDLIQGIFDEIGRNGFRKIIIYNSHGGNNYFLQFLTQCSLWEEKPYSIYLQKDWLTEDRKVKWNSILETKEHGHACECETSITLANYPELVKMSKVSDTPAASLKRLSKMPPTFAGIGWYSNYPEHYAGDARKATKEKGEALRQLLVDSLAEYIAAVKLDRIVPTLTQTFFEREKKLRK